LARLISICGFFKDTNKSFSFLFSLQHNDISMKGNSTKKVSCKSLHARNKYFELAINQHMLRIQKLSVKQHPCSCPSVS
jgi:hypothetical protein